ncbi:hypothetical protein BCR33DRAFT_856921 [Rhizoclosmatium globosum]|uniref:T6SS Phospholipase effector Tle1-like catalytic domain-containing protein n=1 Tax=Rhizoclosmatium globosum TaxID=329046 RepID=A0A1Y2BA28_9FUNG|nr:hypothetical protein BCR33DRAFT_856921 [Rhizoclosmatium globosum]|eukprot:ORY31556.1 hypothetical protein BCR33DRAFT_856921 [Rhizoclosmatium globosum]
MKAAIRIFLIVTLFTFFMAVSANWHFWDKEKPKSIKVLSPENETWNQPIGGGRKLVVLIDGTWQHPGSASDTPSQGGVKENAAMVPSNIVKIAYLLGNGSNQYDADYANLKQKIYYHSGVATEVNDKHDADLEGNFGNIHRHLLDAYAWLAREYKEGDEIYAFGFSRGATIVRSLFSFIRYAGLARVDGHASREALTAEVLAAFDLYRTRLDSDTHNQEAITEFHEKHCYNHVYLKFIGVFDTVEALDVPEGYSDYVDSQYLTEIATAMGEIEPNDYHDLRIGSHVQHAIPLHPSQTREQKWFRGGHADVGGGWWEQGLSDIALDWMIEKARFAGLEIRDASDFEKAFSPFLLGTSPAGYEARKSKIIHDYFANYPNGVSPNGKRVARDLNVYMDPAKYYKSSFHDSVYKLDYPLPKHVVEYQKNGHAEL